MLHYAWQATVSTKATWLQPGYLYSRASYRGPAELRSQSFDERSWG